MKFFCKACETESDKRELCTGCGTMLTAVSDKHFFILEVVDQVVSAKISETVIYERRGPFSTAKSATQWWERNLSKEKYVGCTANVSLVEPPLGVDSNAN